MDKGRHLILFFVLAVIVGVGIWKYRGRELKAEYRQSEEVFGNPLMGFAPCAWYEEPSEDVSLLYVDVTWRELEPEKGEYNWEAIEEENQFARWKKEGKHLILRFVCDIPGDETHQDIPDWLYEETGDGDWYDMEYGKGYSPDYGNAAFIRYHKKAVEAMGDRWGKDSLISYIQLGSLGHWGEWHVNYSRGITRLPKESIRLKYVEPWEAAFPNACLMMRRPFSPAAQKNMGLFNDMAGDPDSTGEWLDWIKKGGAFNQTGEEDALVPMEDFWKTAPVGGELTSGISMEELTGPELTRTVRLIRTSHTTFLGPKVVPGEMEEGYKSILGSMGYRLWVSKSSLKPKKEKAVLEMCWENSGAAPFYGNWPVVVSVKDEEGRVIEHVRLDGELSKLLPGKQKKLRASLSRESYHQIAGGQAELFVEIQNPETGKASVRLANEQAEKFQMRLY